MPSQNCVIYILVTFNAKAAEHLEMTSMKANSEPLVLTSGCTFGRLKKNPLEIVT